MNKLPEDYKKFFTAECEITALGYHLFRTSFLVVTPPQRITDADFFHRSSTSRKA